eukprot:TRINITY_DN7380_c0_g1_i1.p1 TRINITY_DN7380_c0_g1~~TRINITY_DN7380_c0_g1_i1.p1  ORF type:complete len:450 (-),score=101.18 TRINITY_DN7380_c0_g1_i1:185-1534(-)
MSESETDPLLGDQLPSGTRIYASRWYIVGIFSIFGTIQSWQWSLYAPLNLAVKGSYDWSESSFAMMTNWGNISFIFSIIPMSWILEKKGLRPAVLLCCTLSLLSLSIRCVSTSNPTTFMAFAHIGSIMNGVSGTMVLSAPAVLSSTWFPPSERTIATSISQMFAVFGNALSLLVGPRVVSDAGVNATDPSMTPENVKTRIRGDMFHYLLIFTIINILLSLAIWIHFPSKPKMPPSSSSTALRDDFMSGILKLIKNKTAWLLVFAYSAMIGIQSGWSGIQSLDYEYLGINDKEAGNIGLIATLSSCGFGLFMGFLGDRLRRKYRPMIIVLLLLSALSFTWFALLFNKVIPTTSPLPQIVASVVLGSGFSIATLPLYYEYSSELLYPVSEGEIGAFLSLGNNALASLFCFIFFIPNLAYNWMNYLLVASCLLPLPALLLISENYARSELDT